jgi:pyruvate dehydrogenase E2 component (dihydrolipoamide acetyltransferase)
MAVEFFIPKLEETEEVTIVSWLVEDGTLVNEGDEIIEVETDKAVVPVPAGAEGVLRIGNYKAGDVVPTETTLATIEPADGTPAPATETAEMPPTPKATAESALSPDEAGPKVTPVAQKMATDLGVDLNTVAGSGKHGKITKADVQQAARGETPKPEPEAAPPIPKPAPAPSSPPSVATPSLDDDVLERVPLKSIRGVIARRMAESVHTTARVTLVTEVDATELVSLREQLKARFTEPWGFAPGYNDLLALIVANALRQHPYMNARMSADGESIEYVKPINMGMAVDTERGLLVPVIKDADKLGLQEFGTVFRDMVDRARQNKSNLDDLSGGTFTITSLGIYRVEAFTPVINLPQAAILGVGRINAKPVVKNDEIVARKMLTLSLVFDHRLTDGAPAARFLDYICEMIEEPYLLFLTKR